MVAALLMAEEKQVEFQRVPKSQVVRKALQKFEDKT
jgi:hypothetical protein